MTSRTSHIQSYASRPGARSAGFTLVEMMVALALGLFLVAVIAGVYITSRNVLSTTNAASSMSENARMAFEWIGNSVRQTNFNGCARLGGSVVNGDIRGATYNSTANWWQNFSQQIFSQNANGFSTGAANGISGTEALIVIGADSKSEAFVSTAAADAGTIPTTQPHGYSPGQTLFGSDCQTNTYFVADNTTTASVIGYTAIAYDCSDNLTSRCGSGGGTVGIAGPKFSPGALIQPIIANAYFVAPASHPRSANDNSLWVLTTDGTNGDAPVARELANGVQDMQIDFGLDTDGDGSVNGYVSASAVTNWNQVSVVRVHLLMASLPDSKAATVGSNATQFNGGTYTPDANDRRIYREYIGVFSLRNRTS